MFTAHDAAALAGAASAPAASTAPIARRGAPALPPAASGRPTAVVRMAGPADHAPVRRLLRRAYRQYRDVLGPVLHDRYLEDLCDLEHRLAGAELLLAELDGTVVGTATFHPNAQVGQFRWPAGWTAIRAVGVDPACRGQGIAEQLVRAGVARAVTLGSSTVGLHTADFMGSAVGLYERLGFRRLPELDINAAELVAVDGDGDGVGDGAPSAIAYRLPIR